MDRILWCVHSEEKGSQRRGKEEEEACAIPARACLSPCCSAGPSIPFFPVIERSVPRLGVGKAKCPNRIGANLVWQLQCTCSAHQHPHHPSTHLNPTTTHSLEWSRQQPIQQPHSNTRITVAFSAFPPYKPAPPSQQDFSSSAEIPSLLLRSANLHGTSCPRQPRPNIASLSPSHVATASLPCPIRFPVD
ncbi:hypothetical protein DL95DRAFT_145466 [Leptodontidium sp. 2 PMI_412]|nr:hypothetical protein DL95DRAFT_145466 [Leptodontidium sp. 2 PMI_412]